MNPIFNLINKEAPDMLNQFLNFYRNFNGDPKKELDNIVNSGKYSKILQNCLPGVHVYPVGLGKRGQGSCLDT